MKHSDEDIQFQLSQLLDGQLGPEEAGALLKRIEQDPLLAEEFHLYQSLEGKLSEFGHELPAVDWDLQRETIHSMLERETLLKAPLLWPMRVLRWSAVAAAAAAVVVLTILLMPGGPSLTPPGNVSVVYTSPSEPAAADMVLASAIVLPDKSAGEANLSVAFQPGDAAPQDVQFERVSALRPSKEVAGTVVVSVGVKEETASSASNWFLREFQ